MLSNMRPAVSSRMYNEVKAGRLGQVLGFALLEPDVLGGTFMLEAKEYAVAIVRSRYPSSTIVAFCTRTATLV